jgi:hypothetical protein
MRDRRSDLKAAKQIASVPTPSELRAEIRKDLEATNAYIDEHGSFAELVRQHDRDEE